VPWDGWRGVSEKLISMRVVPPGIGRFCLGLPRSCTRASDGKWVVGLLVSRRRLKERYVLSFYICLSKPLFLKFLSSTDGYLHKITATGG
jgi:hypothetical protein